MLLDESDTTSLSSSSCSSSIHTGYNSLYASQRSRTPHPRKTSKMRVMSREEMSETMWKWQYKLRHIGQSGDKTLEDFSSTDDSVSGTEEKGATAKHKSKAASSSAAASPLNKNGELGSSLTVKTLYEGPNSREGNFEWVDYPPRQLSKSAARAQDRVAIKVFKVKDKDKPVISGRYSLRYHKIEIQNPLLIGALAEVLQKQDIHLDANENASFSHPFRELYFAYDDVVAKHRSLGDDRDSAALRPYMLLLVKLLDDIFSDTRAKLRQLRENKLISYKLAWALFPKNTTVITWGNNCELLCKVKDTSYDEVLGMSKLSVRGKILRFNGTGFGWEDSELEISSFGGNRPITELPVYPLDFYDGKEEMVARLTARGRKVLDLQGLVYVNYQGIAIRRDGQNAQKHNVDSRVLIDVVGYNKHHLALGPRDGTDPQTKMQQVIVSEKATVGTGTGALPAGAGGTSQSNGKTNSLLRRLSEDAQERNKAAMLALEEKESLLMYMQPLIEGYALKNKLWVSFYVEDIRPMEWNDEAYDHLVYEEQQKDLVMSFVENHGATTAARKKSKVLQDVIAGKGKLHAIDANEHFSDRDV
jgi:hypothetical protein